MFGSHAGLRVNEAIGLIWSDIDWDEHLMPAIDVVRQWLRKKRRYGPPKSRVPRRVPMRAELETRLARWWDGGWERAFGRPPEMHDPIVPRIIVEPSPHWDIGEITPMADTDALKRFQSRLAVCGLPPGRVHDLRHTFGSLLINHGVTKDVVAALTHPTHTKAQSVEVYLHYSWETLCKAVRSFPRI
jgi:integrase